MHRPGNQVPDSPSSSAVATLVKFTFCRSGSYARRTGGVGAASAEGNLFFTGLGVHSASHQ